MKLFLHLLLLDCDTCDINKDIYDSQLSEDIDLV